MRAVWITRHGPPEVLQVRESPDPEPDAGEIRIRVKAAGLNFAEVMARQGLYPDAPKPPCVVGYEVSGVIDAIGSQVDGLAVGNRVLSMCRFGGHADTVVVPASQARLIPHSMSFEEAAALPVNYITAYHMLFRVAFLQPAETLLVHMAAGGVGTAVLQLCRTVDGVITFGTASASKHALLKAHGCDHPIDYRSKDYQSEVLELTKGSGVDIVLDPLGGRDWKKGYQLLAPAGRLIAFGFANMASGSRRNLWHVLKQWFSVPRFSPLDLMDHNRTVAGVNVGHLWREQGMMTSHMDALLQLYQQGKIKPHIDSTYSLEEAAAAHQRIQERKNTGKIILRP